MDNALSAAKTLEIIVRRASGAFIGFTLALIRAQ